jgi:malto-oligosyltrehalose trehalohydrolase
MQRLAEGWFEAEAPCGAGTRYRYRLRDGLAVPDPASRAQADDVHGPSLVVDPRASRWRNTEWRGRPWEETVLYELHAGLLGGFGGVQRELQRLADLGITAIELMPINDFPGKRNWGYDGVLPFAPDRAYGSPDDLKALVDAAHDHGLMIFLDVVYNHFGPDGNYIASYAPEFFRDDVKTPWGPAIDFRRPQVRQYFTENALYWLMEYRFDGLRFDAVHAITESDWLDEMAAAVRATVEKDRHVHLVLEHDGNVAEHLRREFNAQWNDDAHHVLHVMLTGESEGYYCDYADRPAERLVRALREGFVYQGEPSAHREGERRGTPSADLLPTAFVLFLQNHDQIGNRAFGDRLTALARKEALEAAIALQLICPQIPLIFMGEEIGSPTPFQFFTDHHGELADAVREGRRKEFASFASFSDPAKREKIPDPNAPQTFDRSRPEADPNNGTARSELYRKLLAIRREHIVPRLKSARAIRAEVVGPAAVIAQWRLGEAVLTIATNLGPEACRADRAGGNLIFETRAGAEALKGGQLAPFTTLAFLE